VDQRSDVVKRTLQETLERAHAILAEAEQQKRPEPGSDAEVQMFIDQAVAERKSTLRQFWPDFTS
jgi:hypothetical protein